MAAVVSKERTKMSRTRGKRAAKAASARRPAFERKRYAVLYAALLFLCGSAIIALLSPPGARWSLAGRLLGLFAGMVTSALLLRCAKQDLLQDNRNVLMFCTISLLGCLAGWGIYKLDVGIEIVPRTLSTFILPFTFVPMLITILANRVAGMACGIWNSLFMTLMVTATGTQEHDIGLIIFGGGVITSIIVSLLSEGVKRRSQVIKSSVFASTSQLLSALIGALVTAQFPAAPSLPFKQAGMAIVMGLLVGVVVLVLLPLFESVFHHATNLTFLEYSDLTHPLLQRMAIEAPGTYHHSLIVATLAQAAADNIGANSLLTRVCSYFHDIGKLTKPGFFTENQRHNENPHDELSPSMSTLIITAHVKEGVSLATIHKLPGPIVDVIREHHGNSVIKWFHHKAARQQQDNNGKKKPERLDDSGFRYNGPSPRTRESGIISLADSIEAASRSLNKPTPKHIEALVNDLTNKKIADAQLDHCKLTLAELSVIKRSFVFTLTNMLHARVPYPEDDNTDSQPTETAKAGPERDKVTDDATP